MLSRSLLTVCTLLFALAALAEPQTPQEFINAFKSGTQFQKQEAAQALEWAGISSPAVFDMVEAEALRALPEATDKNAVNYESYLAKALAYSGNEKYRASLEKIAQQAPHKKVKKYAEQSLPKLAVYTRLNKIIAPGNWPTDPYPTLNQRLLNMLKSDDTTLLSLAAKRVNYASVTAPEVLAQLNASLLQNYQKPLDDDRLDAIAWLCHALAGSRSLDYKSTVETVAAQAQDKRLRKYAKRYLGYYTK